MYMKNRWLNFLFLILIPFKTTAWDGSIAGKIAAIDVTDNNNYDFRVTLEGAKKPCGNDNTWAYLNHTDSNYNTYISVLLAAHLAGKEILVFANQEKISGKGYCHIGYISIR